MSRPTLPLFEQPWPEGDYRFFQLGFVVDGLIGTCRRWVETFGIGPFHVMPRSEATCLYRGSKSTVELQIAVAQAGPVQIELIEQTSEGPSVFREVFAPGASGLHQLCTVTPEYDAKCLELESRGYDRACEMNNGRQRIAYFDTFADFGFFTENAESTPSFLDHLSAISETCAQWDGTDPVRLLTRDGYTTP